MIGDKNSVLVHDKKYGKLYIFLSAIPPYHLFCGPITNNKTQ